MNGLKSRILLSLLVVSAIIAAGLLAGNYVSMDALLSREARLRLLVETSPVRTWLITLVIYVCVTLIPGTGGKAVVIGWMFGFWPGVLLVDIALTIAGMVTFLASRSLLQKAIEERYGIHLSHLKSRLRERGGLYLLMLRFMHTPFSFLNYAAGATNIVPFLTFAWTTLIGMLPGTMVFVFAGTRIPRLSVLAEKGVWALLDRSLITALILTGLMPLLVRLVGVVFEKYFSVRHTDCSASTE